MSRPFKHPNTGVYYFRKAVPDDLREALGKREIKLSLKTKDPAKAREEFAKVAARIEREWRAHRSQPAPLSHRQIMALAGTAYREMVEAVPDEPGEPSTWAHVLRLHERARAAGKLEQWVGPSVDRLLLEEGIRTDPASRARLLEEVDKASVQAAAAIKRRAEGDYRPDPDAARFPAQPLAKAPSPFALPASGTLTGLVDAWWTENQRAGRKHSTYDSYKSTMTRFVAFVGHEDPARVTPENVIGFKDFRLAAINPRTGKAISPKTVKDSDLAGLKAVFDWAVTNRRVLDNPAKGVTLKLGKRQKLRSSGFTDEEARSLLQRALNYQPGNERANTAAAKRWVPWLCAYNGARVGEMAQLRKEDLRKEGQTWVLTITPAAGKVKTDEAREIPLHEHLVEMGFPAFVRGSRSGHLFLTPAADGDVTGPLKGLTNRLAAFAREVITDGRVAPTHGWRHRFKTLARDVGMDPGVRDAIQGHSTASVAEAYGEVSIKAKAAAISLLPRYEV